MYLKYLSDKKSYLMIPNLSYVDLRCLAKVHRNVANNKHNNIN